MNDDQFDDLKQFISATVSQATASMATKDDLNKLDIKIDRLELKVDELSAHVAEALDNQSSATDDQLRDHEVRIVKLESQAA